MQGTNAYGKPKSEPRTGNRGSQPILRHADPMLVFATDTKHAAGAALKLTSGYSNPIASPHSATGEASTQGLARAPAIGAPKTARNHVCPEG